MPYGGNSCAALVESPPVKSARIVDKSAREIMVQAAGPCHVRNEPIRGLNNFQYINSAEHVRSGIGSGFSVRIICPKGPLGPLVASL